MKGLMVALGIVAGLILWKWLAITLAVVFGICGLAVFLTEPNSASDWDAHGAGGTTFAQTTGRMVRFVEFVGYVSQKGKAVRGFVEAEDPSRFLVTLSPRSALQGAAVWVPKTVVRVVREVTSSV